MAQWRKVIVSGSDAVLNQISASGNIVPISDNGSDLGSSALEWKDLYIDGTANLDTVDIDAGAIDGTAIGANSHTTIKGTTIDATTDFTIDGLVLTADTITNDAALSVVSTGLTFNASLDIALSADGGNVTMDDGTTTVFDFNTDDPELKIMDDAQVANYASIAVGANGATTFTTVDTDAAAANLTITADGTVDIDSAGLMTLDSGAAINIEPAGGSAILLDGTISIDGGVVTGATSITSTNFVGIIDGALGSVTPAAVIGTTIDASTDFTIDGLVLTADTITNDAGLSIIANGSGDITLDPAGNNVLPGGDSADSLGASGTAWAKLWVDDIDLAGQGSISMGGTAGRIDLDADDDTSIRSAADDVITFEAGAVDILEINATSISGSSISTGSFGHVKATTIAGDGAGITGLTSAAIDTVAAMTNNYVITATAGTAVTGEVNLQFDGTDLVVAGGGKVAFRDNGGEYIYSVSDNVLGLAAGSEIDLTATTVDINGLVDISGNLTVGGNLIVSGDTTTLSTTNLAVGDQFIFAATGSAGTNVDAGLIVQSGSFVDSGSALYHDIGSERWAVAKGISSVTTAVTPKQMVVTTAVSASSPHSSYGEYGVGEMWIETDTQDIWIRTE